MHFIRGKQEREAGKQRGDPAHAVVSAREEEIIAQVTIVDAIVSDLPASSAAIVPLPNMGASFAVIAGTTGP